MVKLTQCYQHYLMSSGDNLTNVYHKAYHILPVCSVDNLVKVYYMSRFSYFRVVANAVSSYGWYHVGHNSHSLQYNDELSVVTVSLQEQGKNGLTVGPTVFPTKLSRLSPEGSTDYIIRPHVQSPAISWL